jgi:hypothetical protein
VTVRALGDHQVAVIDQPGDVPADCSTSESDLVGEGLLRDLAVLLAEVSEDEDEDAMPGRGEARIAGDAVVHLCPRLGCE